MSKQETISFFEFIEKFDTEDKCREHLFQIRWPNGFKCPKCGNEGYYPIKRGNRYQCSSCRYQASVTSGTVMDKSHLPLVKWFWSAYMVGTDKRGCSATVLENKLDISYKTAWYLHKRLQTAMMERDWDYTLSGIVELDEAFIGATGEESPKDIGGSKSRFREAKSMSGKRVRGTSKAKVVAGLSLSEKGRPRHLKMEETLDLKADSIAWFAENNIKSGSTISTDAYSSYKQLQSGGYNHKPKVFNPKEDKEHLKWLHIIISNAKAFINGTFHGIGKKHLSFYLAEFCYRFNRRFKPDEIFNRLLFSCLVGSKISFADLTL